MMPKLPFVILLAVSFCSLSHLVESDLQTAEQRGFATGGFLSGRSPRRNVRPFRASVIPLSIQSISGGLVDPSIRLAPASPVTFGVPAAPVLPSPSVRGFIPSTVSVNPHPFSDRRTNSNIRQNPLLFNQQFSPGRQANRIDRQLPLQPAPSNQQPPPGRQAVLRHPPQQPALFNQQPPPGRQVILRQPPQQPTPFNEQPSPGRQVIFRQPPQQPTPFNQQPQRGRQAKSVLREPAQQTTVFNQQPPPGRQTNPTLRQPLQQIAPVNQQPPSGRPINQNIRRGIQSAAPQRRLSLPGNTL